MEWNIRKCMYFVLPYENPSKYAATMCHFEFKNVQLFIKISVYVIAENRYSFKNEFLRKQKSSRW